MKRRRCDHMHWNPETRRATSAVRLAVLWKDTAEMVWHDDECSKCGRTWRYRVQPFPGAVSDIAA